MSNIKVTNRQIALFMSTGRNYINHIGVKHNPLAYAIQKMLKRVQSKYDEYQGEAQDLRAEFALIKDGAFVTKTINTVNGPVQETEIDASKVKEYNKRLRLLEAKEVGIDPIYAKILPENLEQIWVENLVPFVIKDFIEPESDGKTQGDSTETPKEEAPV